MINLNPVELELIKLLLSELYPQESSAVLPKRILTREEKISTLDILRSKFPDLFAGLTEKNLKDNNFLIKYLSDPLNINKIRNLVKTLEETSTESGRQETLPEKQEAQPVSHPALQVPPPGSPDSTVQLPSIPTMGATGSSINRLRESAVNPGLRFQTGPGSTLKTLGSKAGIFARTNLDRIARGIVGPGLTNTANFLGKAGNEAINAFARLSNQASRIGSSTRGLSGPSGKLGGRIALAVFLAMFLFVLISSLGVAIPGTTTPTGEASPIGTNPTGAGCPDTSGNKNDATCHYLNPSVDIFHTSISQSSIDSYVSKYSSVFTNSGKGDVAEFTKRVNYIVTNSQQAGLNPAIFLGYWKTESNFSTVGSRDLGCAGDNFYEQVDCALGINTFSDPAKNPIANCARSKDANSIACISLKSIRTTFDKSNPVKYPIATFDDFAESYGPYSHLNDQGLHTNCTHTYNELIDVTKELNVCVISPPPSGGTHPTAPGVDQSILKSSLISQFGVTMNGFDNDHLKWAWEKLWDISNTNFIKFARGSVIVAEYGSQQVGCPGSGVTVYLEQFPEALFKYALIHELGHVIRNCNQSPINFYTDHLNAFNKEKGVTYYANNAPSCTGSDNESEDYAEMVARYLNPNTAIQMIKSKPDKSCNPPASESIDMKNRFPLHYNTARSVLGDY